MIAAKAVMASFLEDAADVEPLTVLSRFRRDFHACLTARDGAVRPWPGCRWPRSTGAAANAIQEAGTKSTAASGTSPSMRWASSGPF
jgi:hypothetical protein